MSDCEGPRAIAASSLRARNNSCKNRLYCEAEADWAMVVEGGRLQFGGGRGALGGLREHLTMLRGASLSEGAKLSRNKKAQKQKKWCFSAFPVLHGMIYSAFSVSWMM